jgi:hypothetical protein
MDSEVMLRYDLKVCDDCTLVQILLRIIRNVFLDTVSWSCST